MKRALEDSAAIGGSGDGGAGSVGGGGGPGPSRASQLPRHTSWSGAPAAAPSGEGAPAVDYYGTVDFSGGFSSLLATASPPPPGVCRLLCLNVNSLLARAKARDFPAFLRRSRPTLFLAQEVKSGDFAAVDAAFANTGLQMATLPRAGASRSLTPAAGATSRAVHGVITMRSTQGDAPGAPPRIPPPLRSRADLPPSLLAAALAGASPADREALAAAKERFATRVVTTWCGAPLCLVLVNVYAPNSGDAFEKLPRRRVWDAAFHAYVRALLADGGRGLEWPAAAGSAFLPAPEKAVDALEAGCSFAGRVVVMGDLNVIPTERDIVMPLGARVAGCSEEERANFQQLLALGLHDVWRERSGPQAFTPTFLAPNWRGRGVLAARFDAALVSSALLPLVRGAGMLVEGAPRGDHLPLFLDLQLPEGAAVAVRGEGEGGGAAAAAGGGGGTG